MAKALAFMHNSNRLLCFFFFYYFLLQRAAQQRRVPSNGVFPVESSGCEPELSLFVTRDRAPSFLKDQSDSRLFRSVSDRRPRRGGGGGSVRFSRRFKRWNGELIGELNGGIIVRQNPSVR